MYMLWAIIYQKLRWKYEIEDILIDPFFRVRCNALILFITILMLRKRV